MRYSNGITAALLLFSLIFIFTGCKSEQEIRNEEYRQKLASLKINMAESQVSSALGESKYQLNDQPDSPYVKVYFYPSPDTAIGMAKCYFNKYFRLMKVEWNDSVYLDIKNGGPVQPSGRNPH